MKYKVFATIKEVGRICDAGHKVGDVFEFSDPPVVKDRMCIPALVAMFHSILAMQYGDPYWQETEGKPLRLCCPDSVHPVVFELTKERIE